MPWRLPASRGNHTVFKLPYCTPVVEEALAVVGPRQAAELDKLEGVWELRRRAVGADAQNLDARPVAAAAAQL